MIPVCEPLIHEKEIEHVMNCLKSGWISSKGKYVDRFEQEFSAYCGVKYGVTTTSGTTAIHLALAALGIGEGDEVILPTFTMIGSTFPVIYCDAKPVLVDCEPDTWNMDPAKLEEKVTERTKAIMVVHIYGHPVDMAGIWELAKKYNLWLIEDAAEAHGAEYKGRKAGGLGNVGCFSFYANKIVTTGEGGMVVTDDEVTYQRAVALKDLAHSKEKRFLHEHVGFNYRLTNLQAAIGVSQLERIDQLVEVKRRNAALYHEGLKEIEGLRLPVEKPYAKNVYWMYGVVVQEGFGMSSDELQTKLRGKGVETRSFFVPMHRQPVFQKLGLFQKESYPVADYISERGLYLPSGLSLTKDQIEYVCKSIAEIQKGCT